MECLWLCFVQWMSKHRNVHEGVLICIIWQFKKGVVRSVRPGVACKYAMSLIHFRLFVPYFFLHLSLCLCSSLLSLRLSPSHLCTCLCFRFCGDRNSLKGFCCITRVCWWTFALETWSPSSHWGSRSFTYIFSFQFCSSILHASCSHFAIHCAPGDSFTTRHLLLYMSTYLASTQFSRLWCFNFQ